MKAFSTSYPTLGHKQLGLTLIELMVSLAIGLILVAGMATLIAQQSSSRNELDKSARQIESGRYALTLLQNDIQLAGYYGQYAGRSTAPAALPDPCSVDPAVIDPALALPMQGYDAPAVGPSPLSACIADANHVPGTDILVIRMMEPGDTPITVASLTAGQIYMQTTPAGKITALGPDPTPATPSVYTLTQKDGVTPATLGKVVEYIYFVSPCNVYAGGATTCTSAADNGAPIPTLKRLELTVAGGAPALTLTPLVEGIENLQFDYGIDSVGDGTAATPFITAPSLANWLNVVTVQVNLLARNSEATLQYVNAKTFNMGVSGSVGPFSDAFKRHAYSADVRVINVAGQRE